LSKYLTWKATREKKLWEWVDAADIKQQLLALKKTQFSDKEMRVKAAAFGRVVGSVRQEEVHMTAAADERGLICTWLNGDEHRQLQPSTHRLPGSPSILAWSPHCRYVAAASKDQMIIWNVDLGDDAQTGGVLSSTEVGAEIVKIVWSPKPASEQAPRQPGVIVVANDGQVCVVYTGWCADNKRVIRDNDSVLVNDAAWSTCGRFVFLALNDGSVIKTSSQKKETPLVLNSFMTVCNVIKVEGNFLLVGGAKNGRGSLMALKKKDEGHFEAVFKHHQPKTILSLDVKIEGDLLLEALSGDEGGTVVCHHFKSGQWYTKRFRGHSGSPVLSVHICRNRDLFATRCSTRVNLWTRQNEESVLNTTDEPCLAADFNVQGNLVVAKANQSPMTISLPEKDGQEETDWLTAAYVRGGFMFEDSYETGLQLLSMPTIKRFLHHLSSIVTVQAASDDKGRNKCASAATQALSLLTLTLTSYAPPWLRDYGLALKAAGTLCRRRRDARRENELSWLLRDRLPKMFQVDADDDEVIKQCYFVTFILGLVFYHLHVGVGLRVNALVLQEAR